MSHKRAFPRYFCPCFKNEFVCKTFFVKITSDNKYIKLFTYNYMRILAVNKIVIYNSFV